MGVKSTIFLIRKDAESQVKELCNQIKARRKIYSNIELENILEALNDAVHGGEGYENYGITSNVS